MFSHPSCVSYPRFTPFTAIPVVVHLPLVARVRPRSFSAPASVRRLGAPLLAGLIRPRWRRVTALARPTGMTLASMLGRTWTRTRISPPSLRQLNLAAHPSSPKVSACRWATLHAHCRPGTACVSPAAIDLLAASASTLLSPMCLTCSSSCRAIIRRNWKWLSVRKWS